MRAANLARGDERRVAILWCNSAIGATVFTFTMEFVLWSILDLAAEFDNPFEEEGVMSRTGSCAAATRQLESKWQLKGRPRSKLERAMSQKH